LALLRKIMRITCALFFVIVSATQLLTAADAFGQALENRVNLNVQKADLYTLIQGLKQDAGVDFAFTDGLQLEAITVRNVRFNNESMHRILIALLHPHRIDFEEKNGVVMLYKMQQPGWVTGRIADAKGEPLAGASIRVRELNRSFTTDSEGNYRFSASPGTYTLEVSYVSYATQRREGVTV